MIRTVFSYFFEAFVFIGTAIAAFGAMGMEAVSNWNEPKAKKGCVKKKKGLLIKIEADI